MNKQMDRHIQVQTWLAIYPDLSAEQRLHVDQHLATCPQCAALWRTDQRLDRARQAWVRQQLDAFSLQPAAHPDRARARFQQAIRHSVASGRKSSHHQLLGSGWGIPAMQSPRPRWVPVAVIFVLLLLGMALGQVGSGISLLTNVYATGTPQSSSHPQADSEARRGIEAALLLEYHARAENALQQVDGYLDPAADPSWRDDYLRTTGFGTASAGLRWLSVELLDLRVDDDWAQARVQSTSNHAQQPRVEEGRFYRRVNGRWWLTSPPTPLPASPTPPVTAVSPTPQSR